MSRRPFEVSQAAGGVTPQHLTQWSGNKVVGDAEALASDIHGLRVSYALNVNFNASNTDTPILLPLPSGVTGYRVHGIRISGASAAINAATCGVFTQPSGTGVAVVASGTPVTITQTGPDISNNMQSLAIVNQDIIAFGDTTLYFRVQTPEGSTAKANVSVLYELLDITSTVSKLAPPLPATPSSGAISSAGVFDSTGALVRTLWSASPSDPRAAFPPAAWDGTLDGGAVAPTGNYTITLLTHNVSYVWEGVIGNTSPNHSNVFSTPYVLNPGQYVYNGYHSYGGNIIDLAISPAGEMYFVTGYDERMNTTHVATTANPQYANGVYPQFFRSTGTDMLNVCTDGILAYFHHWDGGAFNFVQGVNCSTKAPITFSAGTGTAAIAGNCIALSSTFQFIQGIAVQQSGNYLFVSRAETEGALGSTFSIWVCNKTTGALLVDNLLGFNFQGRICCDPTTGNPWVAYLKQTATASATWDEQNSTAGVVFSNADLTVSNGGSNALFAYSNGHGTKVYFEVVQNRNDSGTAFANAIGIASAIGQHGSQGFLGFDATSAAFYGDGSYGGGGTPGLPAGSLPTFGVGANVGIAVDIPNSLIWARVNGGLWNGSPTANPATGTGGLPTGTVGTPIVAGIGFTVFNTTGTISILTGNFASSSWVYTAPAGFSQLPGVTRTPAVSKLNFDGLGNLTDSGVAVTALSGPAVGLSISPDGSTLLVADSGSQQIKAFNTSDGSVKSAFAVGGALGDAGGYNNGPAVSNTRYMFQSQLGFAGSTGWVAYQADGSFWFGDAGNLRYLHFSAGNSPTYIERIGYFPGFYACWVCRNDPTRVFGGYCEYKIDYTKPLGVDNGSWTLVNNWGLVPGGVQGFTAMKWTLVGTNGRTYTVINTGFTPVPIVYELSSTGYRNTGILINFDYIDGGFNLWAITGVTGGNGHVPDGDQAQFFVNRFTGFDGSNNPTWQDNPSVRPSRLSTLSDTFPPLFPEIDSNTSTTMLPEILQNGVIPVYCQAAFPGDSSEFQVQYHLGGIDAATGKIKFKAHPPQPSNWGGTRQFGYYPPVPCFSMGGQTDSNGVTGSGAGSFQTLVPGKDQIFVNYRGESWGNNQTNIWTHFHQSGLCIGRWGCCAPYFGFGFFNTFMPANGLLTIDQFPIYDAATSYGPLPPASNSTFGFMGCPDLAGNINSGGCAFVNGSYYVYCSDEWYHGGVHRWRVDNTGSIKLTNFPVSWNAASYNPPAFDPYNFLSGLPYNTVNLPNNTGGWTRNPTTDNTSGGSDGSSPWIRVSTSRTKTDLHSPDFCFECDLFTSPFLASVSYNWTRKPGQTGNWTLNGSIIQLGAQSFDGLTVTARLYWSVFDNVGKEIIRFENLERDNYNTLQGARMWVNYTPNFQVNNPPANGIPVAPGPVTSYPTGASQSNWRNYNGIQGGKPLSIIANVVAKTMTFAFAGFVANNVPLYDPTANIAQPAVFKFTYDNTTNPGGELHMIVDIQSMVFSDL